MCFRVVEGGATWVLSYGVCLSAGTHGFVHYLKSMCFRVVEGGATWKLN